MTSMTLKMMMKFMIMMIKMKYQVCLFSHQAVVINSFFLCTEQPTPTKKRKLPLSTVDNDDGKYMEDNFLLTVDSYYNVISFH